jgi:hypothetical protein
MIRLSEVTGRIGGPTFPPTMPGRDEQTDNDPWGTLGTMPSIRSACPETNTGTAPYDRC